MADGKSSASNGDASGPRAHEQSPQAVSALRVSPAIAVPAMDLDAIDHVTALRNHRQAAIKLRKASVSGPIDIRLAWFGEQIHVFSIISAEGVRRAIAEACADFIIKTEQELARLGVRVKDPEPIHEVTVEEWKRECGMYQNAWRRELGPHIAPKHHLIDALVIGTRNLRAAAAKAQGIEARQGGDAVAAPSQDESPVGKADEPIPDHSEGR